jgi:hypothetical protein
MWICRRILTDASDPFITEAEGPRPTILKNGGKNPDDDQRLPVPSWTSNDVPVEPCEHSHWITA